MKNYKLGIMFMLLMGSCAPITQNAPPSTISGAKSCKRYMTVEVFASTCQAEQLKSQFKGWIDEAAKTRTPIIICDANKVDITKGQCTCTVEVNGTPQSNTVNFDSCEEYFPNA